MYGNGFLTNDLFILGLDYSSFSCITWNDDDVYNLLKWYARQDYIKKIELARLARKGWLGSLANISLLVCEHYLARKVFQLLQN